jgi:outer membrane receptor protein involved in Fe transport
MGYFSNIGRTKRQGLDLGLSGKLDKFTLSGSYSYIKATYDSSFELSSPSNSSGDDPGDDQSKITVNKGMHIPGIPKHQFKFRANYQATPDWSIGVNLIAFSDRYMHGNENNQHQANSTDCADRGQNEAAVVCGKGKISGFAIVNLDTQYNVGGGWKFFAKAINVFDRDYETTGRLAASHFNNLGGWDDIAAGSKFVSPGAPRAGWIGVRYEFGGAPEAK